MHLFNVTAMKNIQPLGFTTKITMHLGVIISLRSWYNCSNIFFSSVIDCYISFIYVCYTDTFRYINTIILVQT